MTFVNLPARGLRDRSFGELYFFANATIETYDVADWRHYSVTARRDSSGRTTTGLSYRDATGDSTARCPGLKVRWSAGRGGHVSMVVPRSCMQVSRTLAISASSGNPVVNRLWDSTTKKAIVSMD